MKKNLIKKVFAVSLSIAMACSFLPAANPVTASAAAPYVSLKTTFKTLKVNQSYKMTLKNNTINWKIKKVETTDKTIATVYGKTTSQVMIKGKSEGRATVRVRLKTSSRKANNTKTLRCRVKVVPAATAPDPTTPVQTSAEVKTQAELDAALSNSSITKITINPTTAVKFEIKANAYPSVDLIVDAPLSDIDNSATFKSITVNNIKPETWTERAKGNSFSFLSKAARMIIEQTASVRSITIGTADAKFDLAVNKGTVENVNVNAKSTVNITGAAAENAALIKVIFSAAAADATFTTELPSAISLSASVNLTFKSGAVDSTVKLEAAGIKATIKNETSKEIVVTKNDGKTTEKVRANSSSTVNAVATTPVNPGTSTTYPGSSVTKPATSAKVTTPGSITVTGSAIIVPGTKIYNNENKLVREVTTTECAITVGIEGTSIETSNSSDVVEYEITASSDSWTRSIGKGTLDINEVHRDGNKVVSICYKPVTVKSENIGQAKFGDNVTVQVSLKVKESTVYAASSTVRKTAKGLILSNVESSPSSVE